MANDTIEIGYQLTLDDLVAFNIPLRAFEKEQKCQKLYKKCVEYHKAAQGETADV